MRLTRMLDPFENRRPSYRISEYDGKDHKPCSKKTSLEKIERVYEDYVPITLRVVLNGLSQIIS